MNKRRASGVLLSRCLLLLQGFIVAAVAFGNARAAEPPVSSVAAASELQSEFYAADSVQEVHLTIAENDLRRMHEALPERISVPAVFRWRDQVFPDVAVRFKGNSSSSPQQQHKRSFLVRFDEYSEDTRFLGMRRVSFDNGVQFGSLFSEPIITEIMRDLEIPVHRCNYAKLYINQRYYGVYGNVERIDDTFLQRQFGNANGLLFKVDEGGPGGDLRLFSREPDAYGRAFELKHGDRSQAYEQLLSFVQLVNAPAPAQEALAIQSEFHMQPFLRVTAVLLFAGAFDQLTGWNPHNYYLYRDPDDERWHYLPWDLDVGFCEVAFGRIQVLRDWHAAWPAPGGTPSPLLEQLLASPQLRGEYRRVAAEILERFFQPESMCARIDQKYELIREALHSDPFPHARVTNPADSGYDSIVQSMKEFVVRRYATARQQLASPGQRPQFAQPREAQPQPGPSSPDAPSELALVSVTSAGVALRWRDNAENEAGTILQRADGEEGAGGSEFRNHIGQPGGNIASVTDPGVRPGGTYRYRVYSIRPTPRGMSGTGVSNVVTVTVEQPLN